MLEPSVYDMAEISMNSVERAIEHHKTSAINRVNLQKMMKKNPVVVVADPSLKSSNGLPAIEFVKDPVKPHKTFKMGKTKEAMISKMLKMT